MREREIHIIGLVALRALAEYDAFEYGRATDLSKHQLERRIEDTLARAEEQKSVELYDELKAIINDSKNPVELRFLLQQFYSTCLRRFQYYALRSREERSDEQPELDMTAVWRFIESRSDNLSSIKESELTHLAVMRLLRELPEYNPVFGFRMRDVMVDCLLLPNRTELPIVVIESKSHFNEEHLNQYSLQLKTAMKVFGKNSIGVLIAERTSMDFEYETEPNIFLLLFNIGENRFLGGDLKRLLDFVRDLPTRG